MKPSELSLSSGAPERALITSRAETHEAVLIALGLAERWVRCLHRDLGVFDLASAAVDERLSRLLLSHRSARIQLLVDDADVAQHASAAPACVAKKVFARAGDARGLGG